MKSKAMTQLHGIEMIEGAGHWIQQEQPVRLGERLLTFMKAAGAADQAGGRT
jgi:pimeloyl-ACP methyl ester carboxylesterase